MNLAEAQAIAQELIRAILPYCDQAEIAGSIRRRKPENVKDVEIVARPRWEGKTNLLHAWATSEGALEVTPLASWIKPGATAVIPWDPTPEGRYWRGLLTNGAKLDLFLPTPDGWGAQLLIRTGSAEFSAAVMAHAKRVGHQFQDGVLTDLTGAVVPCYHEADVFRRLGLEYIAPHLRTGRDALRRIPR